MTLSTDGVNTPWNVEPRSVFNITAQYSHVVSNVTSSTLVHDAGDAFDVRLLGDGSGSVFVFEFTARSSLSSVRVTYWMSAEFVMPAAVACPPQSITYGE